MKKKFANLEPAFCREELVEWVRKINDKNYKLNDGYFEMADLLLKAKENLSDQVFAELLVEIAMTPNTAGRHINNAKCPRLKKYRKRLQHITSWGTLTEIRKLNDDEFSEFKVKYLDNKPIAFERRHVIEFKKNKGKDKAFNKNKVVEFSFDVEHEDFSIDRVRPLLDALKSLKKVAWVKIKMPAKLEADIEDWLAQMDDATSSNDNEPSIKERMEV